MHLLPPPECKGESDDIEFDSCIHMAIESYENALSSMDELVRIYMKG